MKDQQRLVVTISDIDMAGAFEPGRRHLWQVRIIRDVYPPRIDLAFTLTDADGAVVKSGERKLRDVSLMTPRCRIAAIRCDTRRSCSATGSSGNCGRVRSLDRPSKRLSRPGLFRCARRPDSTRRESWGRRARFPSGSGLSPHPQQVVIAAGQRDERRMSGRLLVQAHQRHVHVEEQRALRVVADHALDPEER